VFGDLILRHGIACQRAENAVDRATVITQLRELRLDGGNRRISHRRTIINGRAAIVRLTVRIVIVWVVVVGVIRKVIPRVESGIQSKPETVVKDKEAIVIEMCMPSIPIAVPIAVMTFSDVVRPPVQSPLCGCSR